MPIIISWTELWIGQSHQTCRKVTTLNFIGQSYLIKHLNNKNPVLKLWQQQMPPKELSQLPWTMLALLSHRHCGNVFFNLCCSNVVSIDALVTASFGFPTRECKMSLLLALATFFLSLMCAKVCSGGCHQKPFWTFGCPQQHLSWLSWKRNCCQVIKESNYISKCLQSVGIRLSNNHACPRAEQTVFWNKTKQNWLAAVSWQSFLSRIQFIGIPWICNHCQWLSLDHCSMPINQNHKTLASWITATQKQQQCQPKLTFENVLIAHPNP